LHRLLKLSCYYNSTCSGRFSFHVLCLNHAKFLCKINHLKMSPVTKFGGSSILQFQEVDICLEFLQL
jgi:hypothetical protein